MWVVGAVEAIEVVGVVEAPWQEDHARGQKQQGRRGGQKGR